ncbi:hypothetical protein SDC9_183558 [bioreactor metagenome]|uniref:Uncharacterized protein n=1 Tax=bioreactor metagenome TaxID=1076179 RepID=A0A645HK93_9ZZZZ
MRSCRLGTVPDGGGQFCGLGLICRFLSGDSFCLQARCLAHGGDVGGAQPAFWSSPGPSISLRQVEQGADTNLSAGLDRAPDSLRISLMVGTGTLRPVVPKPFAFFRGFALDRHSDANPRLAIIRANEIQSRLDLLEAGRCGIHGGGHYSPPRTASRSPSASQS